MIAPLMDNEDYYRVLVTSVKDYAITCLDDNGIIQSWNEGIETLLGYKSEEVIGKHFSIFYTEDEIALEEPKKVLNIVRENGRLEFEAWRMRKDGSLFWADIVLNTLTNEAGEHFGFVKVTKDITNRVKAEKKFRDLLESAPDAMVIVDHFGIIQLVNTQTLTLFGYHKKELIGQNVEILIPERYHSQHNDHRESYYDAPRTRQMGKGLELLGIKKNGEEFYVEVALSPIETEEGMLASAAIRDISERKHMEIKLAIFNKELEEQVAKKTSNLNTLNHQLRLLSAHLQTAREEERKWIAREIHDELGQILTGLKVDFEWLKKKLDINDETTTSRLDGTFRLLDDMRTITRRISRQLHPALLDDLGLSTALSSLCREFSERLNFKIQFQTDISDEDCLNLPQNISIGCYRIFQEALNNIVKHSEAGLVDVRLFKIKNNIELIVWDNGKGFDIVQHLENNKGLGMISMNERAIMMGGDLVIESHENKGTEIHLIIPLREH